MQPEIRKLSISLTRLSEMKCQQLNLRFPFYHTGATPEQLGHVAYILIMNISEPGNKQERHFVFDIVLLLEYIFQNI